MSNFSEPAKNLSRTVLADAVVLLVSVLITIIVPRFLGVEEYGYWQLYLLYGAYVQVAQLGWSDGVIVRKAGVEISRTLGQWFTAQLLLQLLVVSIVAAALGVVSTFQEFHETRFILAALAVNVIFSNCRFMCLRFFQATRQMRIYSTNIMFDRIVYAILVFGVLAMGISQFEVLVIGSLIARILALALCLWATREYVTFRVKIGIEDLREALANISSGARTLLAVISGSLTIAIVRIVVERKWGVEVFSNVSLGLNIAGLVSLFVSGLSYALLPYLRRTSITNSVRVYNPIRSLVSCTLIASLLLYFPATLLFEWWLPQFGIALDLLFLLFPIVVFEGRTALITVTYLRSARRETTLLLVNVFGLIFSATLAFLVAEVVHSLALTVSVILVALAAKSIALEYFLARHWKFSIWVRAILEVLWVLAFVVVVAMLESWAGLIFLFLVAAYCLALRRDVSEGFRILKRVIFRGPTEIT